MGPIKLDEVEAALSRFVDRDCYLHLETTNGAYSAGPVGVYIRNGKVRFSRAVLKGKGPYRTGLQMEQGWIYAEGLTDWEIDREERLLMAGYDEEGRLMVALELSLTPFGV